MPRYDVTIPKVIDSGPMVGTAWRNVYKIEAPDYDTALAAGDVIANNEMLFHADIVAVQEIVAHLRDGSTPPRTPGKVLAVGRHGALSPGGSLLPFWNCVRVDFVDTTQGRPERKYYRPPLYTSQVTGLVLETFFFSLVEGAAQTIANLGNYVGPSGEGHSGYVVHSLLQMRQQHWHRRQRPGFKRGYVPLAP